MDKWDRKTNFNCDSCMFYVPKTENSGRCRRQAPTMKGFPVVYGNADWCGEHKIGSNPVRDAKEGPKPPTEAKIIEELNEVHREVIGEAGIPFKQVKGSKETVTKEDVRKVLDEPLPSPVFDQPLVSTGEALQGKPDDNRKKETITAVYPVDLEEKAEIIAEIVRHLNFMCGDLVIDGKRDDILKYMPSEKQKIQELLEKL